MKIKINFPFKDGPWGGGNQFLKALQKKFEEKGWSANTDMESDVLLFNSSSFDGWGIFLRVLNIKRRYPEKVIVYRIDGPISVVRGGGRDIDKIIALFNVLYCDGIVFQSSWSKEQNKKKFGIKSQFETIIYNAPDGRIFNQHNRRQFFLDRKIRLISSSWSPNPRKGFFLYQYLDKNLDFSRFDYTFVGNSPIQFQHIRMIKPLSSEDLAYELKDHDIYITASQNDPCSNALIEALTCGLPAVAFNSGGHPELIKSGGVLFSEEQEVVSKIQNIVERYDEYQEHIQEFSIFNAAQDYYDFFHMILSSVEKNTYNPKRVGIKTYAYIPYLYFLVFKFLLREKVVYLADHLRRRGTK